MKYSNKNGFTLGEIMIALTVIGIVAVLILPQLIMGQRTSKAKGQFSSAYSDISKIVTSLESNGKSLNTDTYERLVEYSRVKTECGKSSDTNNTTICNVDNNRYTTFSGKTISPEYFSDGSFVLKNGMLVAVKNDPTDKGVLVSVDINGKTQEPNKWGWDLFTFEVVDNDLLPEGAPGTKQAGKDLCSSTSAVSNNGITCAYKALSDENYFDDLYKGL